MLALCWALDTKSCSKLCNAVVRYNYSDALAPYEGPRCVAVGTGTKVGGVDHWGENLLLIIESSWAIVTFACYRYGS